VWNITCESQSNPGIDIWLEALDPYLATEQQLLSPPSFTTEQQLRSWIWIDVGGEGSAVSDDVIGGITLANEGTIESAKNVLEVKFEYMKL